MKRFVCCALLVCMLLAMLPFTAYASETTEDVIYFEDGSYLTISITTTPMRASGTKNGSKTYTYNYDGGSAWKATLSGSFSYTGSSATCTSSSVSMSVYDSAWYTVSKNADKSGASATGSIIMGRKALGVTVEKIPYSLKLTCDANGNLS